MLTTLKKGNVSDISTFTWGQIPPVHFNMLFNTPSPLWTQVIIGLFAFPEEFVTTKVADKFKARFD
jgi:hypothetical protein